MGSFRPYCRHAVILLAVLMFTLPVRAESPASAPDLVAKLRAAAGQDSGDLPADIRTAVKLAKVIPQVNFEKVSLEKALDFIRETTGVEMDVRWNSLEAIGTKRDAEVSLKLTNVTAERTLRLLFNRATGQDGRLTLALDEGRVIVSTVDDLNTRKFTRSYDIREFLPPQAEKLPILVPPPSFDASSAVPDQSGPTGDGGRTGVSGSIFSDGGPSSGVRGGFAGQPGDSEENREKAVTSLISMIRTTVYPDSWAPTGDGNIMEFNGRLLIKATFDAHLAVAGFLAMLPKRTAICKPIGDQQVLLEARLLFVDPGTARKLDLPEAGQSAFLDQKRAAVLLKALTDDPATILTATPRLAIPLDGSANLVVDTPHEYTSWFTPNAEDADLYDPQVATVHEGVIFWAAALGISPAGVVSLKLQPTIQVLDRFEDLPAPGVPARRKLTIQRPVTRRLQLGINASIPDGQTAILGGAMFYPYTYSPIVPGGSPPLVATTGPDSSPTSAPDVAGAGSSQSTTERMFIMFVRPRIAHPAGAGQPAAGGPGDGPRAGAAGTASIDIIDADQPERGTPADADKAFVAPKTVRPIPGADAFAADLYRQLAGAAKNEGNILFSPLSIQTALAMTYGGAAGETAKQMAAACHFTQLPDKTHTDFANLLAVLNNPRWGPRGNPVYKLTVANALWAQQNYPFKESFTDLAKKSYRAELANVDFIHDRAGAVKGINDWVFKQTKGKIKDIISPSVLTDMTRLVLTNAVYFKGTWMSKFKVTETKPAPFKLGGNKTAQTPFMNQAEECGYLENDQFQALEMKYLGGDLSMIVLLPRKIDGLKAMEKAITGENLTKWASQIENQPVNVALPRFKFTSEFSLSDVLKTMGMKNAFDLSKADFSGMASPAATGEPPLYLQAVLHKAFVAVDEEGTEAAAATAVSVSAGSMEPEPKVFTADHPFVFLIRHNATGSILFLGRVTDPRAE